MSFMAERALPAYPTHFTLRLYKDDVEDTRVSTAVFHGGRVFQVYLQDASGENVRDSRRHFSTVGDWIQSVMAIQGRTLYLDGMSTFRWNSKNLDLLNGEFRTIRINPVGKAVASLKPAKPDQKALLAHMAELLAQQSVIDQELNDLVKQITI
jgi:hypothetical protein